MARLLSCINKAGSATQVSRLS